jgi:hypothetical protein
MEMHEVETIPANLILFRHVGNKESGRFLKLRHFSSSRKDSIKSLVPSHC